MTKQMCLLAVVVTLCLTVTMFAGSGDDTKKGISRSQPESSLSEVPEMINYQGVLTGEGGNPLDTTVSMTFSVYGSESGGTALWTDTHGSVIVNGGLFTVLLSIPSTVFEDSDRWLGIAVGDDPEMTPRQRMASVPYAYWSGGGSGTGGCWECPDAPYWGPIYTLQGPVGIGTDNPRGLDSGRIALHVAGSLTPAFVLEQTGGTPRRWEIFTANTDGGLVVRDETEGAYRLMINSEGNVGIGTTEPGAKLDVSEVIRVQGHTWPSTGKGLELAYNAEYHLGYLLAYDRDTESWGNLYFGNCNLGLGTTDPAERSVVNGNIALNYGGYLKGRDTFSPGTSNILKTGWESGRGDYLDLYVPGAGESNEGAKMSLTENGHVGIGTTDPGSHRLYVTSDGSAVAGATAFIENTQSNGIGMIVEATSSDLPLLVTQKGEGDIFRCDSWTGGWHVAFKVDNDGKTTCSVLQITGGSDIAEPFHVVEPNEIEPGMVVVIDPENPGKLKASNRAYDRCVAGIVSGAGGIKPGLTLTQEDSFEGDHQVALTGRVYGLCDASYGSIEPGDLLTTSPTPGYAMKASDYEQAQGAILGKAMTQLDKGLGLVLVLISLQ